MKHLMRTVVTAVCAIILCLLMGGCVSQLSIFPEMPSSSDEDHPDTSTDVEDETETEADEGLHREDVPITSVPSIHIYTEDRKPITSKSAYKAATLSITEAEFAADNITVNMEIRGRGHSSFSGTAAQDEYDSKNSYRIKLNEKRNLLGIGQTADKDWVLIAGKYDISALRNYAVWNLAKRMGSIPYVPSCAWVNVYVNQDYRGLYTLVEKIEVASDRVNIDDSPSADAAVVGYLVEYDLRGAVKTGAKKDLTYFYIPGVDETFEWVIQSTVYGVEETAAIRQHLISCHNAILSGEQQQIESLIDMDSFVDMFILQELSKNPDVGCSSFYMQRDRAGKLFLTAPWDFDFAFGTYSVATSTTGMVADGQGIMSHPWFEALAAQPWFMSLVSVRMEEIDPMLRDTLEELQRMGEVLEASADRNHERWNVYGVKYHKYPSNQVSIRLKNYDEHVDFLLTWIEKRFERMQIEVKTYIDEKGHSQVSFFI